MEYLLILAALIAFFCIVLFYTKNNNKSSQFSEIIQQQLPTVQYNNEYSQNNDIHTLDSRYKYPNTPPVNPMVYQTQIIDNIPVEKDLYSNQDYIKDYILDQPIVNDTNQLNYSGGTTNIIKIPLQMNEPYNEQLRSQEILITPYNRIKYNMDQSC